MRQRGKFYPLLVVLCLIPGVVFGETPDESVELPAEYFFGRWAPGHRIDFRQRWDSRSSPYTAGSYEYCTGTLLLGMNGVGNRLLFDREDDEYRTASFYGFWRPGSNWQVGINEMTFTREESSEAQPVSYGSGEQVTEVERWNFAIGSSASWSRNKSIRVPTELARYAYLNQRAVGRGELLIDLTADYTVYDTDRNVSDLQQVRRITHREGSSWNRSIRMLWGVRDNANLSLAINLPSKSSLSESNFVIDSLQGGSASEYSTRSPSYSIETLFAPSGDLFISVEGRQEFALSRSEFHRERSDSGISPWSSSGIWEATSTTNEIDLDIEYLTEGGFDPAVPLDDYNNAYRRMLFGGQTQIGLSIEGGWRTGDLEAPYESFRIVATAGRGLSNRWQFGAELQYYWEHRAGNLWSDPWFAAGLYQPQLSLKWRSFEYRAGVGPGWHRDNSLDALFGSLLQPGQVTIAAYVELPSYAAREFTGGGPFNGSKFVSTEYGELHFAIDRGMTESLEMSFFSNFYVDSDDEAFVNGVNVGLQGRVRLLGKVDAKLYLSSFQSQGRQKRYGDRYRARFNIRALL